MKLFIALMFVVLVRGEVRRNYASNSIQNGNASTENNAAKGLLDININNQVDYILLQVRKFLRKSGLDPTDLPSHTEDFTVKNIFTYHGRIQLSNGWMQDIRTITRSDNAYINFGKVTKAVVKVPIIIPNLEFGYNFKVKFGLARRSGGIIGNVAHYQLFVHAVYDLLRKKISFKQFDTLDIGEITVQFTGQPLTDWWVNAFIKVVENSIHQEVVIAVNSTLNAVAHKIADVVNEHHTWRPVILQETESVFDKNIPFKL